MTSSEQSGSEDYNSSHSDHEDDETTEQKLRKERLMTKGYKLHENIGNTKERSVPSVEPPVGHIMTDEEFWLQEGVPNADKIKEHLRREGRLSKEQLNFIIDKVYDIFCEEENVLHIESPLTVCGDVHGQFYDLLKLFDVGGSPSTTRYLFLGDYVDRGNFSVECVILMFVYKILYKNTFFMLRGNHECRHLTEHFTFKEECKHKYDINAYESIMDTFDALPLCAIMNKQFFCVHGGISPELKKIDDIMDVDRFHEPKTSGLMCDLLWADPMEDFGTAADEDYEVNSVRGCSYSFSFNAALDFLARNRLLSIIRAHEAQDMGYKMHRKNDKTGFPSVITLFSAPNYLDTYNNKAAILKYENNVINIRQFNATPHPYCLPGFMNVMTWSLPFVAEKVADVLLAVFRLINDKEVEAMEAAQKEKALLLRNKIQSLGRIAALCKQMRTEREALSLIGGLSASGTELPPALKIIDQPIAETLAKSTFEGIRKIDILNEALPTSTLSQSVPSPNSLRRYKSRDNILQKKASREKMVFNPIPEDTSNQAPPPQIKEEVL